MACLLSDDVGLIPLHLLFGPVVDVTLSAILSLLLHFHNHARAVLVGDKSSIKGSNALKVDRVTLDHIVQTEREGSAGLVRDVDAAERSGRALVL